MNKERIQAGIGWGVGATVAMTAVMIAGTLTGLSPMPKPIPVALVARILGMGLPKPGIMGVAIVAHLAYGGIAGGLFGALVEHANLVKALAFGTALWLLMQVVWLPYLGWGVFGAAVSLRIAVATLILHLVFATTLGALAARQHRAVAEAS